MVGTPNADQIKAEEGFVDFLLNPDEKEMRIIGPAGCGKSWLVHRLITVAMEEYKQNCRALGLEPEYDKHALTAMTNKAAQELSDATGLDVQTIHSFLCLAVRPNFKTGKQELQRTASWTIIEKYIIFIDEAFMMDRALLKELRMSTLKCKIVFIGDDRQLDPVEDVNSPISLLDVRTVELTIPVRNSGSPDLQELCRILRQNVTDVETARDLGINHQWPTLPHVPGVIDWMTQPELEALLQNTLIVPNGRNLITAYTNQRINDYNSYLRSHRGQGHLFETGEVLISNDMYERGKFRIRNEATVHIVHADPHVSWINIGELSVPTQYVRVRAGDDFDIPVVLDREFMRDAVKWAAKQAKAGSMDWQLYFQLKQDFADFRPRDAATVHKAQGSTKELVVVDLDNIGTCTVPSMAARLLYVAVSRAKQRVIFFGKLPRRYGGP